MKLLRLLFVLMLGILLWGVDAQAQGSQWTGKFQIAFDENEPDVFYFQIVPDEDGTGGIGSGTVGYVIRSVNAIFYRGCIWYCWMGGIDVNRRCSRIIREWWYCVSNFKR